MFRNIEGALLALKKLDVLKVEIDLKGWYPGKCRKRTGGRPDLAAKLKLAHRQVREQKAGGAPAAEKTAPVKVEVPQAKAETEDQKQRAKAMAEINEMRTMFSLLRKTMEKK